MEEREEMKKENKILIFVITAFFALIIASMAVYMTPYLIAYRTVENCLSENEKKLMDKDSKIEKGKMNSKLSKSEKKRWIGFYVNLKHALKN